MDTRTRMQYLRESVRKVLGVCLIAFLLAVTYVHLYQSDHSNESTRLLKEKEESPECANLASWERNGGIFVYVFALCYLFVALAIVCDDYFVSSLEKITEGLGLPQDVAGSTFMAAGSSAPELFVSLADNVFAKPQESLGIGTIVGSAIFNILIIIALSAMLAGHVLELDWRPFLRDSLWYSWSIIALTYVIWDGSVDLYESLGLFGSYVLYILYMVVNEKVIHFCCKRPKNTENSSSEKKDTAVAEKAVKFFGREPNKTVERAWTIDVESVKKDDSGAILHAPPLRKLSDPSSLQQATSALDTKALIREKSSEVKFTPIYLSKYRMLQYHPHILAKSDLPTTNGQNDIAEELGGYFDELFDVPSTITGKLWFLFTRPIVILARLTIPDCRFPMFSGAVGFTSTFCLSIVWIAILSHFTVVWATKFGCITGIPSALMGLTIIAAGTSIPDALSSILVARDGHGDMAVSNALGSNVFDILLGLGLPFFLSNLVYKEPVVVSTGDLELSIFILFGVLLAVLSLLMISRWKLHPITGAILLLLYTVYVIITYLRGLGKI